MGVAPSNMGDMCVCVESVADSPKRQEAMKTGKQSPSSFLTSVMVYFKSRQAHGTDGLTSPPRDNWWSIGTQSGVGLNDSQNHEKGTMAKGVALWLMWRHWRSWPFNYRGPNPRGYDGLN